MPMQNTDLKNKASSLGTYQKGLAYQKNGRVVMIKDSTDDQGSRDISAIVRGSEGKRYRVSVRLGADGEALEGECDCPAFESYAGFCKHIVATVIQAQGGAAPALTLFPLGTEAAGNRGLQSALKTATDPQPVELMRRYARRSAA